MSGITNSLPTLHNNSSAAASPRRFAPSRCWGGYMLMECDDPLEVHKFCSMLPTFTFEAHPVVPVADAIRVELEAMAYRDGLKSK